MNRRVAKTGSSGALRRGAVRPAGVPALGLAALLAALLAACASTPPPPDWQMNARAALDRSVAAHLEGNTRIDAAELARARAEVARTGRADLLARVELAHCAAQVASLVFGPCSAFEPLRADATDAERAYADRLAGRSAAAEPTALQGIADPLSAGPPCERRIRGKTQHSNDPAIFLLHQHACCI